MDREKRITKPLNYFKSKAFRYIHLRKLRNEQITQRKQKMHSFMSLWNWENENETDLMDTEGMKMGFSLMTVTS